MELAYRTRTQERVERGESLFLLANKKGGYALFGNNSLTHYAGLFYMLPDEWTLFKTVDDIVLDVPASKLTNKYYAVERRSGEAVEEMFFFGKTLYYKLDHYHGNITIDLDMRRVYDNDAEGRIYKIYWEDGCVIVEYTKKGKETFYLVIGGADQYTLLNEWQPRQYAYDRARGDSPERWVYRALRLSCEGMRRLTFTFGKDKAQALYDAGVAWDDWEVIRSRLKGFAQSIKTTNGIAHSSAVFALESLVTTLNHGVNRTGVYGGLPWFFHFWSRDEIVSLQGLVLAEKYSLVKEIMLHYVTGVLPDGRLPNRLPHANLGNADAVGWLWKRLGDFLRHLERKRHLWDYFSAEELSHIVSVLEQSLRSLRDHHVREGLVVNQALETWMDTHGGTPDVRAGARVEVQALTLASLQTLQFLYKVLKRGNGRDFKEFERSLASATKQALFKDGVLWDGFDGSLDKTVRPNVFLAAYIYPQLLSKQEWCSTFDRALRRLWLDWGGLASIDKSSLFFCPLYSGQDNRSYHRGDSWYWVNNLAALAMRAVDAEKYDSYIRRIKEASVRDLLWLGAMGHCSELSSASRQTSEGCFAQAWSAATLVELLDALGE